MILFLKLSASLVSLLRVYLINLVIMIYYCYNLPVIGQLLKKLVNQDKASSVHSHGYNDLIKVVITTLSIILFNCEDAVNHTLQ